MDRIKYKVKYFCLKFKKMFSRDTRHFLNNIEQPKCEKLFSLNDLNNFKKHINYAKTPFYFFVENNINYLLDKIQKKFNENFSFKIGVEIEFYCNNYEYISNIKNDVIIFCNNNGIKIIDFINEKGEGQYEIQFDTYNNIMLLCDDYQKLKNYLIDNFSCNFSAKPKYFDAGSALQINFNLLDKQCNNLYCKNNDLESQILEKSIDGLIHYTNYFLQFYIKNETCLNRYDKDFNDYIFRKGLVPAPTFNSCGINNRTASIRIPVPKNFRDKNSYGKELKNNRRIEFRVPSSDADIKMTLYAMLTSIYIGINSNLERLPFTSNNLLKDNYLYSYIKKIFFSFNDITYEKYFF